MNWYSKERKEPQVDIQEPRWVFQSYLAAMLNVKECEWGFRQFPLTIRDQYIEMIYSASVRETIELCDYNTVQFEDLQRAFKIICTHMLTQFKNEKAYTRTCSEALKQEQQNSELRQLVGSQQACESFLCIQASSTNLER